MPPYWVNKALPTPTLTLSDTFIFNFLIISFIFIENKCLSDAIWEKEKESSAKGGFELGSIASKSMHLTHYTIETDAEWAAFFSVDSPNHMLVGGVSVNSLCQQGGLLALSVNRLCLIIWVRLVFENMFCDRLTKHISSSDKHLLWI